MSNTTLKPMDVYADMRVPFEVAAYCRGHKFCGEAVALSKALREREAAQAAIKAAEKAFWRAEQAVDAAVQNAKQRLDSDPRP